MTEEFPDSLTSIPPIFIYFIRSRRNHLQFITRAILLEQNTPSNNVQPRLSYTPLENLVRLETLSVSRKRSARVSLERESVRRKPFTRRRATTKILRFSLCFR